MRRRGTGHQHQSGGTGLGGNRIEFPWDSDDEGRHELAISALVLRLCSSVEEQPCD